MLTRKLEIYILMLQMIMKKIEGEKIKYIEYSKFKYFLISFVSDKQRNLSKDNKSIISNIVKKIKFNKKKL